MASLVGKFPLLLGLLFAIGTFCQAYLTTPTSNITPITVGSSPTISVDVTTSFSATDVRVSLGGNLYKTVEIRPSSISIVDGGTASYDSRVTVGYEKLQSNTKVRIKVTFASIRKADDGLEIKFEDTSDVATTTFTLNVESSPPLEREEAVDCSRPFWHGELGDNWPLAGVSRKSRPKFRLIIRGIGSDNVYKPGKKYNVMLTAWRSRKKTSKKMHGFLLSSSTDNSTCEAGTFSVKKGKKATPATAQPGCNDVQLDGSTPIAKTRGIKWTAPSCGCVTMSAEIRSDDNMIFYDDPESTEIQAKYKVLFKTICAPANDEE